ncbi:hypothetical protein EDB84DRAFT_1522239, partial [Lactarius hengduanensis]
MRLTMGLLGAMLRGALRSPSYLIAGSKSMNWHPDSFPINDALPRPLTEGGALVLMCNNWADSLRPTRTTRTKLTLTLTSCSSMTSLTPPPPGYRPLSPHRHTPPP